MLKKYHKFIYSFWAIISISAFGFIKFCRAGSGTQYELQGQLNTAGMKGWGVQADSTSLAQIIQYVISAFLGLLGIIFLVLIIYAGYAWMTAQGDEEKVTTAKNTLTRAIIGLVIIIAAYSITYFVFSNLPGGGSGAGADITVD